MKQARYQLSCFILTTAFLLGNSQCTVSQLSSSADIAPIGQCSGGDDCLVTVQNNCPYPIYLFDLNSALNITLLTLTPLAAGQSIQLYSVTNNLVGRAIQVGAGNGLGTDGLPSQSIPCSQSSLKGGCSLGWGNQGTLFEFTYNAPSSPNNIYYDISAVNGFDFPMTVTVTNPSSGGAGTGPGGCGQIDTATLNVNNCSATNNLNDGASGSGPNYMNVNVRQAIYASDFSHIYQGGTDCFYPVSTTNNPITSCRAPRTFGVDFAGYSTGMCPFPGANGSLTYPYTNPQETIAIADLPDWTCSGQVNAPGSLCWSYDPFTTYYTFIKSAVGYGVPGTDAKASIYAFPQDDGYSDSSNPSNPNTGGHGAVVNECTSLSSRFTLVIGPAGSSGATGQCPTLQ